MIALPDSVAMKRHPEREKIMTDEDFVGAWLLIDYVAQAADGTISHPLGTDPYGIGIYTAAGWMSAHLMRRDRIQFGGGRRPGVDAIDADTVVAAAAGYIGYSGRYTVDPVAKIVSHHVESALIPDWIGTVMAREYTFDGDLLTLRPPARGGVTATLRWRRHPS
jgi:hypothetical protein